MTRRQPIRRVRGIPIDADRCAWAEVERPGELLPDRGQRPRKYGYQYCAGHLHQVGADNFAAGEANEPMPHGRVKG